MADVITRLKIESGEYDSKIKRAVSGLQNMEQECRRVDGTLAILEKDQKQYVQSLGQMQTVSNTVRGKIGELTSAYVELSSQYKRLTEEEKKGDFGKALSSSLEQIKQRISDSKKELSDIQKELNATGNESNSTGSILDQLSEKFTINFDAVKLFNTALKAADGAMQVAKDAFFASEATVDEWGRTVEASRSLYDGFLTALNNSDISGYLTRMDQIVEAARKAYDELDRLGTMKTIQGPAISAQQTENDRMRQMIMTGRYIAPVDGRNAAPGMVNGQRLTADQIRAIERNLQGGMQKIVTLVGNEVKQTSKAIDARYSLMAKENGMTLKEFRQGTSSMAEFDKRIKAAAEYEKYERAHTTTSTRINPTSGDAETVILRDNTKNPYESAKNWATFRVDKMGQGSYNDLVNLIRQRDQQAAQAYGMQSQAYRSINRAEGTTVRDIMNGKTGGTGSSGTSGKTTVKDVYVPAEGSIDAQVEKVRELTKQWSAATDQAGRDGYKKQLDEAQGVLDQMRGKVKTVTQEMATGISGLTPDMIKWGENDIKQQMQSVEYGTQEYNDLAQRLIDYNSVSNLMQEAVKTGLEVDDSVKEYFVDALTGSLGEKIPQELYDSLVESLNEFKEYTGDNPIELDAKTGNVNEKKTESNKELEDIHKSLSTVSQGLSGLSSIASGLTAMGIKLDGGIGQLISGLQGMMQVANGVVSIIQMVNTITSSGEIPSTVANTQALAANTIAMGSLAAAIQTNTIASAIPFAKGGVIPKFFDGGLIGKAADGMLIPGNSYSGDRLRMPVDGGRGVIGVNSGELILNMSSQDNLAGMFKSAESLVGTIRDESMALGLSQVGILADALDNEGGAVSSTPYVMGEMIVLGANNHFKANGQGEIVTTQFLHDRGII